MEFHSLKIVFRNLRWILPLIAVLSVGIFTITNIEINKFLSSYCNDSQSLCFLEYKSIAFFAGFLLLAFLVFVSAFLIDFTIISFVTSIELISGASFLLQHPQIKHWFTMPDKNELRLNIRKPKWAKKIEITCKFKKFLTVKREDYIASNRSNLTMPGKINNPLLVGTLSSNDTIEIKLSESCDGKLVLFTDKSLVSGFQDGMYRYIISCEGKYFDEGKFFSDFAVWLTINKGELVKIKGIK